MGSCGSGNLLRLLPWLALATAVPLLMLTARAAPRTAIPSQQEPTARFSGDWHGVYYSYPRAMSLKLNLAAASGNAFAGTVEFSPLEKTRSSVRYEGSHGVQGSYDPATRTFQLTSARRIGRPTRTVALGTLEGVLDLRQPALAGLFAGPNSQRRHPHNYFVLTRPANVESLTGPLRRAGHRPQQNRRAPGGLSEDTLLRWADRFRAEYPKVDPYHTELSALYGRAYNLFADEHFEKHFGQRFDQMSPSQRRAAGRSISMTRSQRLRQYSGLSRAFGSTGTQGAPAVVHVVLAQRALRHWRRDMLSILETLPEEARSFEHIDAIEAAGKIQLRTLWPSERATFKKAVVATRMRLAAPMVARLAEQILREANGYKGARALAVWERKHGRLLQLIDSSARLETVKRIHARLDALIAPLILGETRRLDRLTRGARALQRTNDWYRHFRWKFSFCARRPAFRAAIVRLRETREPQIAGVKDQAVAVIKQMGVEKEVNALVAHLLPIPGDRTTPSGQAIVATAQRQLAVIREARRRKTNAELMAVGAVLAELVKRGAEKDEDKATVAIAGFLRGHLIDAALRNALPKASDAELVAARIVITLALDGKLFKKGALRKEFDREELLAELRRRFPDHDFQIEAANLAYEVFKQFRK